MFPFIYRENLERSMKGKILGEFWDTTGFRAFVPCKVVKEMVLPVVDDKGNKQAMTRKDVNGQDVAVVDKNGEPVFMSNIVLEVEPPPEQRKIYPTMGNYFTRRDCVDRAWWPSKAFLFPFLKIRVPICSWQVGCTEPVDPRDSHINYPITTSAGFTAGLREHDMLEGMGALVKSFESFMKDSLGQFMQLVKGQVSKKMLIIGFVVIGLFAAVGAGLSFMAYSVIMKLAG